MNEHYIVLTPRYTKEDKYIWDILCKCGKDIPVAHSASDARQLAYLHLAIPFITKENSNA